MKKLLMMILALLLTGNAYADKATFGKIGSGSTSVTTPGTAVRFSSTSQGCGVVFVSPKVAASHDTVPVYIGDASVNAGGPQLADGTGGLLNPQLRKGIKLISSDSALAIPVADLNMLYVDSANSQDGVSWTFLQ